jgi:hypothetical protein
VDSGYVAGRRDNASPSSTDNDRFVGDAWIIAFFNARVEGVTIDMRDRQGPEFVMLDKPR